MMDILALAGAAYVSVFALGFQSRNVNHGNYGWAAATSMFIGMSQVAVWHRVMDPGAGWVEAVVYGLAGAAGIVSSMWVHRRFIAKVPHVKEIKSERLVDGRWEEFRKGDVL